MARRSDEEIREILARIEEIVSRSSRGVKRREIRNAYERKFGDLEATDRTFRRWLRRLVEDGRLEPEGEKRGRVYYPVAKPETPASGEAVGVGDRAAPPTERRREDGDTDEADIPLSEAGRALQEYVRRPSSQRDPVGYDRAFLEKYEPGETWYLPRGLRQELLELGETPEPDRPAGTYAREMLGRLLIDLSWASSRLEGNTYSRLDTENLIRFGQEADDKDPLEAQMILNHKGAIEFLVHNAEELRFDRRTILTLHAHLAENLLTDPGYEGSLRDRGVAIAASTYTPVAIPQVIEESFGLLLVKAEAIPDPFEQAFFVMVHIPYLQPFIDVNKRTSRLAANLPLIRGNLKPLSFVDVPHAVYVEGTLAVYETRRIELLRDVFRWAYERSAKQYRVLRDAMGDPDPMRLRYREEFGQLVRDVVRSGRPPRRSVLNGWAEDHDVDAADRERFAETGLRLLMGLREGAAGRYGLRSDEVREWRDRYRGGAETATRG